MHSTQAPLLLIKFYVISAAISFYCDFPFFRSFRPFDLFCFGELVVVADETFELVVATPLYFCMRIARMCYVRAYTGVCVGLFLTSVRVVGCIVRFRPQL